ncbi:hypothetical protein Nmel_007385 [Mimus melanotis]
MVQLGGGRRAPPAPAAPPAFSIDSILQHGPRRPAREQGRARCALPEEEEEEEEEGEGPEEQDLTTRVRSQQPPQAVPHVGSRT